jgi:phenylacetate-CoA ligase
MIPLLSLVLARHGVFLQGGRGRVSIITVTAQDMTPTYATFSAVLDNAICMQVNLNPLEWRNPEDREQFLDFCDPEIYTGDPFALSELAKLPLLLRPKAVISSGMTLLPGLRAVLEQRFGCPVIDLYALAEARAVAFATPYGHELMAHDLYLEVLDSDGRPVPPGTRGEITLSGGRNPFFPLLRYRTGDYARLEQRGEAMLLCDLEGRGPVFFTTPHGQIINSATISAIFRPFTMIGYALHQEANGALNLRICGDLVDQPKIRETLLKLFGAGQQLTLVPMSLAEMRQGKWRQFTSDKPSIDMLNSEAYFRRLNWGDILRPGSHRLHIRD